MSFFHTDHTKIDCIQDCDTASPDSTTSTLIYQDHQVKHEVLDDGLHKLVALQTPIIWLISKEIFCDSISSIFVPSDCKSFQPSKLMESTSIGIFQILKRAFFYFYDTK